MQIKQQQLYATVRSVVSELIIEIDLQSSGRIQYCIFTTADEWILTLWNVVLELQINLMQMSSLPSLECWLSWCEIHNDNTEKC